jgi:hypothetical protein
MERVKTWQWDWALAGWNFRPMARSDDRLIPLDLEAPAVRHRWIQRFLGQIPALLGDFGYPTKTKVSTLSKGDPAYADDWRSQGENTALMDLVAQTADIFEVLVTVNLTCRGTDLEPMEIMNGASIWINVLLDDLGNLDVTHDHPVYISVSLNADIYAPVSHGDVQSNSLLATLNGPRLAGLLERIERDVPAELVGIYDDQYPGMLGPRGFKALAGDVPDA